MKLISHRGNTRGRNPKYENDPSYILNVINHGYECEIDVWLVNNQWILGHDEPQYYTDLDFLKNEKLWCHAKNIDALYLLSKENIKCFFHNNDDVVLTSNGYLWTYPNKQLTDKSIAVLPEICNYTEKELYIAYGICSNDIDKYKK